MEKKKIRIWVPGIARTSGSHNTFKGRIVHSGKYTKKWMDSVAWTAKKEYGGRLILLEGPIKLVAEFYLPRSGNHYGTGKNARNLKGSAPKYHIKKPDLDKLVRAIQDSLTKVIWQDDKQIVDIEAHKYYETNDTPPGVSICVREIELSENQLRVLDSVKEKDNLFNTKS